MKYAIVILLLLSLTAVIVTASLPASYLRRLEECGYYSMGIFSESRLYEWSDPSVSFAAMLREEEEEIAQAPQSEQVSLFRREEGMLVCCFDEEDASIDAGIREKTREYEELDYKSFAFSVREPLIESLTDRELCFVFFEIIELSALAVPINGTLESISFVKSGEVLFAYAEIDLCLSELIRLYHLDWLPEHSLFALSMNFEVKNSELSVNYEKIYLRCETMEIPETLLLFGCNTAFGKKDYRTLLGNAVRNVFVNAGIYD